MLFGSCDLSKARRSVQADDWFWWIFTDRKQQKTSKTLSCHQFEMNFSIVRGVICSHVLCVESPFMHYAHLGDHSPWSTDWKSRHMVCWRQTMWSWIDEKLVTNSKRSFFKTFETRRAWFGVTVTSFSSKHKKTDIV